MQSPITGLSSSNLPFKLRTLSVNHQRLTPQMELPRVSAAIFNGLTRDDSEDGPLQRMATKQSKLMADKGSSKRFKTRHASATAVDYHLKQKLKQDVDASVGYENVVTSQGLESQQFGTRWQRKPSQVSIHSGLQTGRASRSLPRKMIATPIISDHHSQANQSGLPMIQQRTPTAARMQVQTPFKRVAASLHAEQIIGGDPDADSQYFGRSQHQPLLTSNAKLALQASQSSHMSQIEGSQSMNNRIQYQDLYEEKREEIQRIVWKRQQKAALDSLGGGNRDGKRYSTSQKKLQLPEISPVRGRSRNKNNESEIVVTKEDVAEGLAVFKSLRSQPRVKQLSVSSESSGELSASDSKSSKNAEDADKMTDLPKRLKGKGGSNLALITAEQKEELRFGQVPNLETMKRAKNRGYKARVYDTEDKHESRVAKIQQKLIVQSQQKKSKKHDTSQSPHKSLLSVKDVTTAVAAQKPDENPKEDVSAKQIETAKDTAEESKITKDFVPTNTIGQPTHERDPVLVSDPNSPFELSQETPRSPRSPRSPSSPNSPGVKSNLMKSQRFGQGLHSSVKFAGGIDLANATAIMTATKSNSQGYSTSQTKEENWWSLKPRRRKSTKSERVIVTPDTVLSGRYKTAEQHMGQRIALRIQTRTRGPGGKKKAVIAEVDFIAKALEAMETSQDGDAENEDEDVGSSARLEQQKLEQFNSELDIYSSIQSLEPKSPGRRRLNSLLGKVQPIAMKAIPAEDSAEERGSGDSDSRNDSGDGEGEESEQEEDYDEEEENADLTNEREAYKKNIIDKEVAKKEDKEICGQRLVKKIDDFAFQMSVEAGLATPDLSPVKQQSTSIAESAQIGNAQQENMLETGNTSLFRLEKTKNDDQGQLQKVMDRYIEEFRGEQAFYSQCKQAQESKWMDPSMKNARMQYYTACQRENSVAKPILSKIIDKTLILRDLKLNSGDAIGLRDNMMTDPDLVSKLYLDHNGLDPKQLAHIIDGFSYQRQLVNLTIQASAIDETTVDKISVLLKNKVPDHLQELHLIHVKAVWRATDNLVRQMRSRNYLRKLSLVEAGLNDFSMANLCEVVKTQKTLQALDISWNRLTPQQMKPLLVILKKNRRLSSLNLSWNSIMDVYAEDEEEVIVMLGKIIKHSRTMQHMNLSGTGLSDQVIYEMGTFLRRSRSLQALHLSGNPGVTSENFVYLHERIRCRKNEDIERYVRIQAIVKNALTNHGVSNNIINGIKMKIQRETDFNQIYRSDPIQTSYNDQLIFQRMLGHKQDIPGSGQWYETSKNTVACKGHYKNDCWICEGQVYCVLFWSKGMCYKMNPILPMDQTEEIRFEIDRDFGEQDVNDNIYENTNVKYSAQADQVPFVCGSFTGWRYLRMVELEEFNTRFDTRQDAFELAQDLGQIRKRTTRLDQCNEHEARYTEIARLNEKLRLVYSWRSIFAKNLQYKRPFLLNSHLFYEKPSKDGTLPDNAEDMEEGDILSETSSEESEEEKKETTQEVVKEVQKVKMSSLSPEEQDALRKKASDLKANPLPTVPDVNKFDKVFILPIFSKPGKHQYLIKYKDSQEAHQKHILKKTSKQEKRYHLAKNDPQAVTKPFDKHKYRAAKERLNSQCFFYQCDIPKRNEELPSYSKPITTTVIERKFEKEISIWKPWRADTAGTLSQAYNEDIKSWKGYRFIKIEEDREATEAIIKKYYPQLKDLFLYVAGNSIWPYIGTLDFCDFASKAKILDGVVNISGIDRTFIAATLKVVETTQPCLGLRRFEFLEILVRLSNIKYLETKIVKTYPQAAEKLFQNIIQNFSHDTWQEFRNSQLWTMDVNDLLDANMANLQKIYNNYKSPTKQFMELVDCIKMATEDANLGMSEKDITFCYGYCHMTVQIEERHWKKYNGLEFVEFLEFIGRLAHTRFKNSSAELANQPLMNKIEFILDDLCQGFGLTRQEVNVESLEFSESDDDY